MKNINKVIISGNLTRDPETKFTQSGSAILSFGVAVNDSKKNQATGKYEDVANFVDCVMFGARAEAVGKILAKGMKVAIEGKLHYNSWKESDTGKTRSKLEVYVDEIEFMSSKGQQPPQAPTAPQTYQPQYAPQYPPQQYAPQTYQASAPQPYQQPYQPQYPQDFQQAPQQPAQAPQQPAQAPQQPQRVNYPPQQQYAPQQPPQQPAQAPQQPQQQPLPQSEDVYDADIPF